MLLATSILGMKEHRMGQLKKLNETTTDFIHLDIMDGLFVQNKVGDIEELKMLFAKNRKPLDIHFMVNDIEAYIKEYLVLNPVYMTFHIEVSNNPTYLISLLKEHSIKVGIALNPNTSLEFLIPYLDQLDLVLVMSVEAGKGGQSFEEQIIPKIAFLKQYREEHHLTYQIEVDGGINQNTIRQITEADIAVVGSFITNHSDYQAQIELLQKQIK